LLASGAGDAGVACPTIPGVVLPCEPKVIDGCCAGVGPELEQPEANATAAAVAATAGSALSERCGWGMTVRNLPDWWRAGGSAMLVGR
jgi:hypothetical protein